MAIKFGQWEVIDDTIKDGKVLCKCSCGVERYVNYTNLKLGLSSNCGHVRYNRQKLEGMQFGEWSVIEYVGNSKYLCRCSCGKEKEIRRYDLVNEVTKSCGHIHKELVNQQINDWYVIKYVGNSRYLCRCSCGVEKEVSGYSLKMGTSKSCGHSNKSRFTDYSGQTICGMYIIKYDSSKQKWMYKCSCGEIDYEATYNIKRNILKCKHKVKNRHIDLTSKHFGEWEVIKYVGNSMWECRCSCGIIKDINTYSLTHGESKSCGHLNKKFIDISNLRFGKLTAVKYNATYWTCKCDCGNIVDVLSVNLRNGSTTSCGCRKLLFTKYELTQIIDDYTENNKDKPFIFDLAALCNVGENAIRRYIKMYELHDKINKQYKSRYEKQIIDIVGKALTNDRTVLKQQELDIYIPSKKLAIEFNGDYWHSEIYKECDYHQQKTIDCAKKGIQLIHIFEYEWLDKRKKDILTKYLHSKIYKDNIVLGARNTSIKEISNKEARDFLNNNHLMGEYNSKINIALYYNNEIVSILSIIEPRFNNREYQYEISRYCTKLGYSITGGIEKLYKYFINKYNPSSVVTYTDISKFTGNCYSKIGFNVTKVPITKPGYIWIKPGYNSTISRYSITKEFKDKYCEYGNSEDEIMYNMGYVKIYNSGNLKMEWRQ